MRKSFGENIRTRIMRRSNRLLVPGSDEIVFMRKQA